ncbi:MAG: hypothetical protein U1E48_09155 [Paracoccaceae bacterium]
MKKAAAPILFALSLIGCADYDLRISSSSLEPTDHPGEFRWRTIADAVYPINSAKAEALRMAQLRKVMDLNASCATGYAVKDRVATRKVNGAIGDIYDVFYTVQCG